MSNILTDILADAKALVAKLEGSSAVATAEGDIKAAAAAAWAAFTASAPADILELATTLLTAGGSVPWATLVDTLITQAEGIGKSLEKTEAAVVLNSVQSNLMATGTLAAPAAPPAAAPSAPPAA